MATKVKEKIDVDPLSVLGDALSSAAETIGEATANSRESATAAAKKAKESLGTGVYKTAYGLSYGVVFGAVFLAELMPESNIVRRGFADGADSARAAAARRKDELDSPSVKFKTTASRPASKPARKPGLRKAAAAKITPVVKKRTRAKS